MKTFLLAASAAALLAAPMLSSAQTPEQKEHHEAAAVDHHEKAAVDHHDKAAVAHHDDVVAHHEGPAAAHHEAAAMDHHEKAAVDHHDQAIVAHQRDAAAHFDRSNRNWYRARPEFAGYGGARPGFWFVPGQGYIHPDPRWYGFNWTVGFIAPVEFRSYYVADPLVYGLPPAPYGYRYIYLNNNVALINMGNGRIVRILPNVFY